MDILNILHSKLQVLAEQRRVVQTITEKTNTAQKQLEESPDYLCLIELKAQLKIHREIEESIYNDVRDAAVIHWKGLEDKTSKKLCNKLITIKEETEVKIENPQDVITWAIDHKANGLLSINKSAVEKQAKLGTMPDMPVKLVPVTTCSVATDLSSLLKDENE